MIDSIAELSVPFILQKGYQKKADTKDGQRNFDYWREVICDEFVQLNCEPQAGQELNGFSGSIRGGIGFTDLSFNEVISSPQIALRTGEQISKASEDDFLISFQMENQCTVRQHGREALLMPGSFALYDSAAPYSLSFPEKFHQFVIQMPREVLARHLIEPEKYTAISMNASTGLGLVLKDFIFSLATELSSSEAKPSDVLSENLVSLIALSFSSTVVQSSLTESECVKEALVRRIKQFVESNLYDSALNNGKVAESQGISVRYLHKLFRDEEESIHEMILHKRLAAAYELLDVNKESRPTIESIAYHVGFSSSSHFSRAFKAHFGVSPSSVS